MFPAGKQLKSTKDKPKPKGGGGGSAGRGDLLEMIRNGPKLKKTTPAATEGGDTAGGSAGAAAPQSAGGNEYGDGECAQTILQPQRSHSAGAVLLTRDVAILCSRWGEVDEQVAASTSGHDGGDGLETEAEGGEGCLGGVARIFSRPLCVCAPECF